MESKAVGGQRISDMADDETWFEVKITRELARVLQRIVNVYIRTEE